MVEYQLLRDERILIVTATGPLEEGDFEHLKVAVDPFIEEGGDLAGIVIFVKSFPGWEDLAGFVAHIKFVKSHHEKVKRVALCTDSKVAEAAPKLAKHFVAAEIKAFGYDDRDAAMAWLKS